MKKKLIMFLCMVLVMFSLSGCRFLTERKLRAATDSLMTGIQATDSSVMESFIDKAKDEEDAGDSTSTYDYKSLEKYMKDSNAKMTYEIEEVDTKARKVTVKCRYVDSSDLLTAYVQKVLVYGFSNVFSDDEDVMSDENMDKLFQEAIDSVEEPKMKDSTVVIEFSETDDGYKLAEIDDDLLDVATAGILSATSNIQKLMEEGGDTEAGDSEDDASGIADQIHYDVINTDNCAMITFTNDSDTIVDVNADIIFRDAEGKMTEETEKDILHLAPKESRVVAVNAYEKHFADVEIQVSTTNTIYDDYSDKLSEEDNDSGEDIVVKVINEADVDVEWYVVYVLFYKDGEFVGATSDSTYETIKKGGFESLTLYHPYDCETYDDIAYDDYKVIVYGYNYK